LICRRIAIRGRRACFWPAAHVLALLGSPISAGGSDIKLRCEMALPNHELIIPDPHHVSRGESPRNVFVLLPLVCPGLHFNQRQFGGGFLRHSAAQVSANHQSLHQWPPRDKASLVMNASIEGVAKSFPLTGGRCGGKHVVETISGLYTSYTVDLLYLCRLIYRAILL